MKKIINDYGDYAAAAVAVILCVRLFNWFITVGPLHDFVANFVG